VLPAYLFFLRRARVPALPFLRAWIVPTAAGVPLAAMLWFISSNVALPLLALVAAAGAGLLVYALPMSRWWIRRARALGTSADAPADPPLVRVAERR
jgi:CHASE2 domain-containing sensor protein